MHIREISHDVRIVGYVQNEDGTLSIGDIIETSKHYAPYFARKMVRNPIYVAIGACKAAANTFPEPRMILRGK